jgi:hypothetical protein
LLVENNSSLLQQNERVRPNLKILKINIMKKSINNLASKAVKNINVIKGGDGRIKIKAETTTLGEISGIAP